MPRAGTHAGALPRRARRGTDARRPPPARLSAPAQAHRASPRLHAGVGKRDSPPEPGTGQIPGRSLLTAFQTPPLSRGRKSNSPIPAGSQQRGAHEACRLLFPLTNGRSACFQGEPRHLFQGGGPLTRPRNAILMTQLPLKDAGARATVAE